MIFYNGATGGLGRYLGPVLVERNVDHRALTTRIENSSKLWEELEDEPLLEPGSSVVLIHLAAMVSVPRCEADPDRARLVNTDGALEYVRTFINWSHHRDYRPTVLYVSTGHVYAAPIERIPVEESAPTEPRSIYAETKLDAENALSHLATIKGIRLTVARVFGLIAPGQPLNYLLPALIDRARREDVQEIPGLTNIRDYLDARDTARHLHNLTDWSQRQGGSGTTVVNVCSGVGVQIGDVLNTAINVVYSTDTHAAARVRASVTGAPGRATDLTWLVGSPDKLVRFTSQPARVIDLETTVRDAAAIP